MDLVAWMEPRDRVAASRTVAMLCGVAVIVTVVTFPLSGSGSDRAHPVLAVAAGASFVVVVLLAISGRVLDEAGRVAWAACPLLAVLCIVLVDLATYDATINAQIFFVFATLYGGAMLGRRGAILMTIASIAGDAVVVLALLPFREAITNLAYLLAVLVATTMLLVRSAERQEALVAVLERRAATDSLTGLVNRRVFDEMLSASVTGAAHHPRSGEGTALILLDVDRFKAINDEHGHPGGDQVLVQLSELLVKAARRGDLVCRLGGDELAVLMPGCPLTTADRRATELVTLVRLHRFGVHGRDVDVSISAGVAHAPSHAREPRGLYAAADTALYAAKRAGRDRVVVQQAA